MKLPERLYYTLSDAAEKLGCSVSDILHFGAIGLVNVSVYISFDCRPEDKIVYVNTPIDYVEKNDFTLFFSDVATVFDIKVIEDKEIFESMGSGEEIVFSGCFAGGLNGFFCVSAMDLLSAEFTSGELIVLNKISMRPIDYEGVLDVTFFDVFNVDKSKLCLMADEFSKLKNFQDGDASHLPNFNGFSKSKKSMALSDNKKNRLIKALIEVAYGRGSSEKPRSLINENRGTGELLLDLQKMGIKPPVSGSTLAGYLKDVELDYVQILTSSVENNKK